MLKCDIDVFCKFFYGMLDCGVNFVLFVFEVGFILVVYFDEDIEFIL